MMRISAICVAAALLAAPAAHCADAGQAAGNRVAFVNVAGALDGALFAGTVTNGVSQIVPLRLELAEEGSFDPAAAIAAAAKGHPASGGRILSVYFVDSADMPPLVAVPGFLAAVNVRGLSKGADAGLYGRRVLKMALKGLAFACGVGANQDAGRCVMGSGSFETLKGIDGTSATYSPFAYFPIADFLGPRGLLDESDPEAE